MPTPLMQRWELVANKCEAWEKSGRVVEEHTEDEHRYRDTLHDILYDESATRVINITNTEGYAQKNARTIIAQIKSEYKNYTDETVEEILLRAFHVSPDKLDAGATGTEFHRLADLWCRYIISEIRAQHNPFPTLSLTVKEFAHQNVPHKFGTPLLDLRVSSALHAFEAWREEMSIVPIATEIPLIVGRFGTAGKIDLLCYRQGVLTLVDYKTGVLKKAHWLQQVVYYWGLRECLQITPKQIVLWQPSMKNTKYKEEKVAPIKSILPILRDVVKAHQSLTTLQNL